MVPKKRIDWLDYVRFFSIFLVILFHTPPRLALLDDAVILNLRMPVFFCVSGFLYSMERYGGFLRYLKHRSKQILVPYTVFFVIFYALWLTLGRRVAPEDMAIPVLQPLWDFFLGNPRTVVAPFWYIACLFTMQMIYYGIETVVPRRWVMAACVVLSLATYVLPATSFWNLTNALVMMPFYAFGNRCKDFLRRVQFDGVASGAWLAVAALVSVAVMVLAQPLTDKGLFALIRVAAGLLIIPAYVACAKWVARRLGHRVAIERVVMCGTVYLALQNYFIGVLKLLVNHFAGAGFVDETAWCKPAIAVAVMLAIYPFAVLIDRRAPWMLGRGRFFDKL